MSALRSALPIVVLALLAALAGLLLGRWFFDPNRALPPAPPGVTVVDIGERRPELALPMLDGTLQSLAEFDGRPLLINYWATWCPPCIEELPLLHEAHARRDGDGITVLTIALEHDAVEVAAFLERLGVELPAWIEPPSPRDSSVTFGNTRGVLPFNVLIGADGRVITRRAGALKPADIDDWAARAR